MTSVSGSGNTIGRTPQVASRLPRLRAVLTEHVRTTGTALRVPLLIAAALAVVATIVIAAQVASGHIEKNLVTQPSSLPGIFGALLAIAIWAREERFGPGFLWTLPVDRSRHALIKVLAGWLWLMGAVALYAVCLLVIVLASDGSLLPVEVLHLVSEPVSRSARVDPASLHTVEWAPGPIIWAIPFVSATAAYLLVSAFMLAIRRPLLWIAGAAVATPIVASAAEMADRVTGLAWLGIAPAYALSRIVEGRYGLEALLTLRTWSLDRRVILATGERLQAWSAVPDLGDWCIAALLWTGAGLLAVWAAARRHRERRRA